MIVAVTDTHAAIWYLSADRRLSSTARQLISQAAQNLNHVGLSSITMVEIVYLIEKGKIPAATFTALAQELVSETSVFVELPINLDIARALTRVDAAQIADMPDRIVAATALHHQVPVISRDGRIRQSSLQTIW